MRKIKSKVWATAALVLSAAFCVFRVNTLQAQTEAQTAPVQAQETFTPEEAARRFPELRKPIAEFLFNRDNNYRAKLNNASKRTGVLLDQLPERFRADASKVAKQYQKGIYPLLRDFAATHGGLLGNVADIPALQPYLTDSDYKGTGQPMPDWSLQFGTWRMDGTMIARDVYSKNPPDAPHDVWAAYSKFLNSQAEGQTKAMFIVHGWDDGRVTFDPLEDNYYGIVHRPTGDIQGTAPPGAAGIPPKTAQGQKAWLSKEQKQTASPKAKPDDSKTQEEAAQQVPAAEAAKE